VIRLRVTKIDEFQFLTCLKHGLWGSRTARFKDWKPGDYLVFLAENTVAGLARVSGLPFQATEPVWDNGLFPHRIPMAFEYAAFAENRLRILGGVRETLMSGYRMGGGWGLGIVNQRILEESAASDLLRLLAEAPNELARVREELESLLVAARARREAKRGGRSSRVASVSQPVRSAQPLVSKPATVVLESTTRDEEQDIPDTESVHLTAQALLIDLGRTVGCNVWVASNDKTRSIGGKQLGADCLTSLPSMGLSPEATRAIGLIDVIWLKKNAPVAAFEVEATTSVHSGLLRMSDLVELVPALKMELYIVAPRERQQKVLRELARPTFRRIGLSDICRFVAVDDLAALLKKLEGLKGFVQPEIIDTIAIALPEQSESALA
jgi:hypothetical protein